ncbi:hypothetical protein ABT369_15535 [Dactylosporangium sp. NPDC000244]|uniref:hypothetical protein n=1 Tax=Dactylosporangium sp. NPDC000244 TaxID=3154365 RepID=UPI00332BEAE3
MFSLGGDLISARLGASLREAAESPDAPYLYECFLSFCRKSVPGADGYESWRAGEQISYCGRRSGS